MDSELFIPYDFYTDGVKSFPQAVRKVRNRCHVYVVDSGSTRAFLWDWNWRVSTYF